MVSGDPTARRVWDRCHRGAGAGARLDLRRPGAAGDPPGRRTGPIRQPAVRAAPPGPRSAPRRSPEAAAGCPPPCRTTPASSAPPSWPGSSRTTVPRVRRAMILTVTPNVALDITYRVDQLTPGSSHRVRAVEERAGGKGINVARVLHGLGHDTIIFGFIGSATAAAVTTDLARGGLAHELISIEGPTRRSVAVVDSGNGEATLFNEPGPRVPPHTMGRPRGDAHRTASGGDGAGRLRKPATRLQGRRMRPTRTPGRRTSGHGAGRHRR